ncbi:MAG: MraY family glycosyltransferase [Candidatus Saccharicenans sp.]
MAIPRTGGVGIYLAFLCGVLLFPDIFNLYELIFLLSLFFLGFIDDLVSIHQNIKLCVEIILSILLSIISNWHFSGNYIVDISIATFFLVGLINALNIIDGMDGLATGIAIISCLFLYLLSRSNIALIVIMIYAGFLVWNFHKAKIFLGDSGSLFLGAVIGLIGLRILKLNPNLKTLVTLTLINCIPIYDSALSIIRRVINRKKLFGPDINHFYNKIYKKNKNYIGTVISIYFLSAILGALGLLLFYAKPFLNLIIGLFIWFVLFISGWKLGFIEEE